jgi:hypothetical protein
MNIGAISVNLSGPDQVAGVTVYLVAVPERNSTFMYRHQLYRVVGVIHGVEIEGGDYLHSIKLELDYLP